MEEQEKNKMTVEIQGTILPLVYKDEQEQELFLEAEARVNHDINTYDYIHNHDIRLVLFVYVYRVLKREQNWKDDSYSKENNNVIKICVLINGKQYNLRCDSEQQEKYFRITEKKVKAEIMRFENMYHRLSYEEIIASITFLYAVQLVKYDWEINE